MFLKSLIFSKYEIHRQSTVFCKIQFTAAPQGAKFLLEGEKILGINHTG